jgi:hypothetical protein
MGTAMSIPVMDLVSVWKRRCITAQQAIESVDPSSAVVEEDGDGSSKRDEWQRRETK